MQAVILSVAIFSPTAILLLIFTLIRRKNKPKQIGSIPPPTRLPPPPPPRPTRTETVDGTDYIFREHWWFQQYPINDEITLELCVGCEFEWIYGIKPKRPHAGGGYSHDVRMKARQEGLTLEHAKAELDSMYAGCCRDVDDSHQELRRLMEACCCTTNTDKSIHQMQLDTLSTDLKIDELRLKLACQQLNTHTIQALTLPIYPIAPSLPYGYWGGCGYNGRAL